MTTAVVNKTVTYSMRMPVHMRDRLERESEAADRPSSYLVNQALENYFFLKEEKRRLIMERLKDIDNQVMIPGEVVLKKMKDWSKGKKVDWSKI